jgi:hypothetical protein
MILKQENADSLVRPRTLDDTNTINRLEVSILDRFLIDGENSTSEIDESGPLPKETAIVRLRPRETNSNFKDQIIDAVGIDDVSYDDFFIKFNKPVPRSSVMSQESSGDVATWFVNTNFQFLSNKYDSLSSAFNETELPSISATPRKDQFANSPIDVMFSNPTDTLDFVFPHHLSDPYRKLRNYPFYNQINITNRVSNDFSKFVNKEQIDLFDKVLHAYLDEEKESIEFRSQDGLSITKNTAEIFDLFEWSKETSTSDTDSTFEAAFKRLLMAGKIRKMGRDQFRKAIDILGGASCYHEDFAYSVSKYKDVKTAGTLIQNLYKEAREDITTINDTQIKYGATYVYECFGHYIIVGNRYSYSSYSFDDIVNPSYADVTIINEPRVIILPIRLFTESAMVIQPPPIFPQVKIKTENNSKRELQFYLSPTMGTREEGFQPIIPSDYDQLRLMETNRDQGDTNFKFKTDLESGLYEIFRSDTPPKSYSDFADKKVSEIRMGFMSESAIYRDQVKANKKYYYLFRRVNTKNLVSNPTAIYEVELLIDADDSRVIVDTYNLPEPIKKDRSRKFRQIFQITPAIEQVMFDDQQDVLEQKQTLKNSLQEIKLGIAEKSVWGRKFKFRVKSASTGKIIDYNITFKLSRDKTEEDFN